MPMPAFVVGFAEANAERYVNVLCGAAGVPLTEEEVKRLIKIIVAREVLRTERNNFEPAAIAP
jgi:hypothetical protein